MIDLRGWGATDAEIASAMPGDDLITGHGVEQGTRAIRRLLGDGAMVRRQLLGLRERCEAVAAQVGAA